METKNFYETPSVEVLDFAVEQGFAATSVDAGGENGHWGAKTSYSDYNSEEY